MDEDDLPRPGDPLAELLKEDLDRLSVHELEHRAKLLQGEVERTRMKLEGSKSFRSAADELFKR